MPNLTPEEMADRIRRIFAGEYGEDLYIPLTLCGRKGSERSDLLCLLAIYEDHSLHCFGWDPDGPSAAEVYARVQDLQLSAEQLATEYVQAVKTQPDLPGESPDDLLWSVAASQTATLSLPVGMITYLKAQADGSERIVFWHARMAQASWLLKKIQEEARKGLWS